MDQLTLVVLAAGMGSRFGDKKQLVGFGPHGELLPEYTCYDAKQAGFDRVVFIIQEKDRPAFDAALKDMNEVFPVSYAYQSLDALPEGYDVPEGREKPWGTAHALWCAKDEIDGPFAILNADDYYGPDAFELLHDFLQKQEGEALILAYNCAKTLSEHGGVTRGILRTEGDKLVALDETEGLQREGDHIVDKDNNSYPLDTPVSMNSWAFTPAVMENLLKGFVDFLDNEAQKNPLKGEFFLPTFIADEMAAGRIDVTVRPCEEDWFGVTHAEDRAKLEKELQKRHDEGLYPDNLWQ